MAITQTQQLPAPFLTDVTKDYAKRLGATTAPALDTSKFAPTVAGQDPYQTTAYGRIPGGVGAYEPYITGAGAAGFAPGAAQMGETAATTLGGIPSYLTQAGAYSGPTGYEDFMSPYQQDVIDATMKEYDTQAAAGLTGIGQQAAMSGNLGGGREGVMRAQYQNKSDMNRALLQSGLLQQGFTQANQLANQAFGQQQSLASQVPGLYQQDIGTLGSAGAAQQAQAQAELDAQTNAAQLEAYAPYEQLGYLGSGIASIASGMPGQYQSMVTPNPTPLQNALGIAGVAGGFMTGYGDYLHGRG